MDKPTKWKFIHDVIKVLQERIDTMGLKEIYISEGSDALSVVVEAPGASKGEVEEIKDTIENQGTLFFKIVKVSEKTNKFGEYTEKEIEKAKDEWKAYEKALRIWAADNQAIVKPEEPEFQYHTARMDENSSKTGESRGYKHFILRNYEKIPDTGEKATTKIDGKDLTSVYESRDELGTPAVGFKFGAAKRHAFGEMTERYTEHYMAIVLDGVVRSAPVIRSRIEGSGIIEGNFTQEEINRLIVVLKSGALKGKPKLTTELFVGPGLGRDSITKGLRSIGVGLIIVLIIIGIYYLKNGLIANVAVVLNLIFILGLLQVLGATLTLPGIAGMILTVGMAVDANILILERIREEKDQGKSTKQAISSGYDRAFWTIFDANLTTLITAYILFKVGTGPIRGFAVTLMLGIASSMYTALFFTKAVYQFLLPRGKMKEIKMFRLVKSPNLPFVKLRKIFMPLSVLAVVGGLVLFMTTPTNDKYGIDFTGGVRIHMNLKQKIPMARFREMVNNLDIENIKEAEKRTVEGEGDKDDHAYSFLIRLQNIPSEEDNASGLTTEAREDFRRKLEEGFKDLLAPEGISDLDNADEAYELEKESRLGVVLILRPVSENKDKSITEISDADVSAVKKALEEGKFPVQTMEPDKKFSEEVPGFRKYKIITARLGPEKQRDLVKAHQGMKSLLQTEFDISEPFASIDTIGGRVAYNMRSKAFVSVILALLAIIVYITFRFEFKFGIGAILALFHDICIALGAVVLLDMIPGVDLKINLHIVAAFLTIVGYSLNDTIVVYDRIRENLKLAGKEIARGNWNIDNYMETVNTSINQTLSRTLLTSLTTFIAVLVIFTSGVADIQGFALVMMVGIVIGTYSSIFIASPVLIYFYKRELGRKKSGRKGIRN
jgi:SecD/SecF fusion protein